MKALYYGDNLQVLRDSIADESVDLVYLDPPFNSNATYNVLFKSPTGEASEAQIEAFEDSWHWNIHAETAFDEVMQSGNTDAADLLRAMRSFLGENDMMAYLAMMAVRTIELHRVLKPTGSLYLHCDPVASHYLKLLLDAVFGHSCFRSEIIWRRSPSHNKLSRQFGPIHDVILFYGKTDDAVFHPGLTPYTKSYIENEFRFSDDRGRIERDYGARRQNRRQWPPLERIQSLCQGAALGNTQ
jgi:site-specific DNA-methyltransferase (adenine-specific)